MYTVSAIFLYICLRRLPRDFTCMTGVNSTIASLDGSFRRRRCMYIILCVCVRVCGEHVWIPNGWNFASFRRRAAGVLRNRAIFFSLSLSLQSRARFILAAFRCWAGLYFFLSPALLCCRKRRKHFLPEIYFCAPRDTVYTIYIY